MARYGKLSCRALFVLSGADVLHISVETDTDGTVVRMAGRLAGESLKEATKVCFTDDPPQLIDASELRSADADGLAFLATILDGGFAGVAFGAGASPPQGQAADRARQDRRKENMKRREFVK